MHASVIGDEGGGRLPLPLLKEVMKPFVCIMGPPDGTVRFEERTGEETLCYRIE